jgi:hypothetical protein
MVLFDISIPNPSFYRGLAHYVLYSSKKRAYAHLKYAKSILSVVRSWQDLESGTIRIQWRFSGITQLQIMAFWRYNPMNDKGFKKHAR